MFPYFFYSKHKASTYFTITILKIAVLEGNICCYWWLRVLTEFEQQQNNLR